MAQNEKMKNGGFYIYILFSFIGVCAGPNGNASDASVAITTRFYRFYLLYTICWPFSPDTVATETDVCTSFGGIITFGS